VPSMPDPTPEKRRAISKRVRYEVLRRDNHTCRYCHATDSALTIDHVVPVALGGTDEPSNLVAACRDCNSGKTSSTPDSALVAQATDDALRWSAAMEVAAGLAADDIRAGLEYADALDAEWKRWSFGNGREVPRPAGWHQSATAWRAAGLPIEILIDSARLALGNDKIDAHSTWRYFCGIAWKRLAKIQEAAAASLADPSEDGDVSCEGNHRCECEADAWRIGFDSAYAVPLMHPAWIQARSLSRVVDGVESWNTTKREAAL
jgi:hypothetical protein